MDAHISEFKSDIHPPENLEGYLGTSIARVFILNQDEIITVHAWRFQWSGNTSGQFNELNPPIGQTCTDSIEDCSALEKFVFISNVELSLPELVIQIAYRKSGGRLKHATSKLYQNQSYTKAIAFIPRGVLEG